MSALQAVAVQNKAFEKAISRALGEELRRVREERGWSRGHMVERLLSGIGERTLLSYEHGTRQLTVLRLIEVCRGLGTAPPTLLNQALQRASIQLANLVLRVDLRHLLNNRNERFRPMHQWARNRLTEHPDGVVELSPLSVRELAAFVGCGFEELAEWLAGFLPEDEGVEKILPAVRENSA